MHQVKSKPLAWSNLLFSLRMGAIVRKHLRHNDPVGCAPTVKPPMPARSGRKKHDLWCRPAAPSRCWIRAPESHRNYSLKVRAPNYFRSARDPSSDVRPKPATRRCGTRPWKGSSPRSAKSEPSRCQCMRTGRPTNSSLHAIFAISIGGSSAWPTTCLCDRSPKFQGPRKGHRTPNGDTSFQIR